MKGTDEDTYLKQMEKINQKYCTRNSVATKS